MYHRWATTRSAICSLERQRCFSTPLAIGQMRIGVHQVGWLVRYKLGDVELWRGLSQLEGRHSLRGARKRRECIGELLCWAGYDRKLILESTRVGERGQVTILKEIRDQFGLGPETEVEFRVVGGNILLKKAPYAERCIHLENQRELRCIPRKHEIRVQALIREAHFLASRAWRTYRQQGGKRARILADFFDRRSRSEQTRRLLSEIAVLSEALGRRSISKALSIRNRSKTEAGEGRTASGGMVSAPVRRAPARVVRVPYGKPRPNDPARPVKSRSRC